MNEEVRKYVDPVNRNIDIVLIITSVILVIAFGIIYYMYEQNEFTKVKFKINEIKDITWVNELNDITFTIKNDKLNLSIDSTPVIEDASFELNKGTGEIIFDGEYNGDSLNELKKGKKHNDYYTFKWNQD